VVLDAIRDRGLTGNATLCGSPAIRVFADQGDIYWAETVDAPSIGARLVDAGALTAVQLERGAVRHDGVERLERLFERVQAVERDTVLVAVRALAERSLASIAGQMLATVVIEPYIHHTSGIHLWNAQHPVARRNNVGRAALWSPPEAAGSERPETSNRPLTSSAAAAGNVDTAQPVAPASDAQVDARVDAQVDAQVDADPSNDGGTAIARTEQAEGDDFSLVWNDVPARAAATDAGAPGRPPPASTETPTVQPGLAKRSLGDEFEVKWPAGLPDVSEARTATDESTDSGAVGESAGSAVDALLPLDRRQASLDVTREALGIREPRQSLTDALNDLMASVDRDLSSGRRGAAQANDTDDDLLSADELVAVRGAIASADTGLLDARRRLVEHRLRDRSSRGSSDGLHTTEVSDDSGHFGGARERDDLDDLSVGAPSLRRMMGNLRRT